MLLEQPDVLYLKEIDYGLTAMRSICFLLCVAHWDLRSFTHCTSWGSLDHFSKLYFRINPFSDDSRLSKVSLILSLAAPHILIKTEAKCYDTFHTYVKIMMKTMWLQGAWKSGACDSGQITLWGHKKSVCYSSANLTSPLFILWSPKDFFKESCTVQPAS